MQKMTAVFKHAKLELHNNALNKPASIQDFFVKHLLTRQRHLLVLKQNIASENLWALRQEEIAFNAVPKLVQLENRLGVDINETHVTVPKCKEFTACIDTTLKNELINNLKNTDYLTICCDGSTNVVTNKEIIFVMFINKDTCAVELKYLKITDLPN
ncbi:hypothetical protein PR048_004067 [Dryococelus australis]|uniref:DUF4371 domain-containing protein n=1 Tax=Dryococelus australis TaxID=614101 RepID=A0ABQ9I4H7_9NEOP|nr:hypothetical protein PR048_004067 [Dryococelus australis]